MSDTATAIRAAREVQADTLAPEYFREASDWFFKAKTEYRLKNFKIARDYAEKARRYAERAEFESLRGGATRNVENIAADPYSTMPPPPPPPPAPVHRSSSDEYATPTGTPVESWGDKPAQTPQVQPQTQPQMTSTPNSQAPLQIPPPPQSPPTGGP